MEPLPDWLGRDLVAGGLPWAAATPGSFPGFLDRYTLHDASWIGLFAEPDQHATLLLHWAAYWLQGEPSEPGHRTADAPILAVRFEGVERSDVRLRCRTLTGVVSGPTNRAADWHRTQLSDRHGGEATMVHAPTVRLLCLSAGRELLPVLVPAEMV
jgi:hypothetical protein